MASTYSTSLKIQLMGNGEDSGTWGSITNTNWNLIEQAIAGVQTITMANSNYTLTNLNGVSDEARNMVLVVNGTNSAIYQVIAPLAPKFYVISNQTVGGYAITIGGASGSIVTIPNGTTAQVYCDGTSFYSAQTSSSGNFNVNGNLVVSGTTTLTGLLTANAGISSTAGNFSGNLASLGSVSGASGIFGAVSGTSGTFSSSVSGTTITAATQFSGPGTGLTGTAAGLSIGGNAATATNATNAGYSTNALNLVSGGTVASNVTAVTQALGTNNTTIATTAFAIANGIPSGAIVMWSGSIASIPSGWYLCNGANGTPDLRDRFVVGAGSTYNPTNTGGTKDAVVVAHTHGITDPGHAHTYRYSTDQNVGGGWGGWSINNASTVTDTAFTGISVNSSGVSGINQNLPPYYALAFIMKA